MDNGSYYITIKVTDICDNEQPKTIRFSVENAAFERISLPTVPLFVGLSFLALVSFMVIIRIRRPSFGISYKLRTLDAKLAAELKRAYR
ncbi:MAG: hypothetical protein EAX81_03050 [Candidatus Thorarchaeota archaeon]|nr:hypothetical protein [Candidatus Thorarchaeota archaeon]